jgi:hypothetical protein
MFASRMISQVRCQLGGRSLDLRFVQHVAVTTLNFDDIELAGYYRPSQVSSLDAG